MRRPGWDAAWLGSAPACPPVPLRVTDWPQAPAGLGFGVAGLRPCVLAVTLGVTDWPQAPAGLEKMASNAGRAGMRRGWAPPLRARPCPCGSLIGLNRRPGCEGSRFVRRLGRAGPHRGTSSQTAGCGVNWSKAA
ncbi:hypothetical protein JCM18897A_38800 [Streptomyces sp. JCM 18897]